jgi:hypothetical protein
MQANSYGDCDESGSVNSADLTCFQSLVNSGHCLP